MKSIFAFERIEDYEEQKSNIEKLINKLNVYRSLLEKQFGLEELPQAIVWTSKEIATTILSNIPIPAFTNELKICISPSVDEWQELFLSQLENQQNEKVEKYYKSITLDHVFCVLAHEITHHIELFMDDFDDSRENSIWFEEGMCEYLSHKLTLSPQQFEEHIMMEHELIEMFKEKYGQHPLDKFGVESYNEPNLTAIMINYWRSSKAIRYIVEDCHGGDVHKVFSLYHEWDKSGKHVPLTEYFGVTAF